MTSISPIKVYKYLLVGIIIFYGIKLFLGRFLLFYTIYVDISQNYREYDIQYSSCFEEKDEIKKDATYHTFTKQCELAYKKRGQSIFLITMKEVIEKTHSCVEYPCTDILKLIMESWIFIFFVSIFLLITFFFLFPYINDGWKQKAYIEYQQQQQQSVVDRFLNQNQTWENPSSYTFDTQDYQNKHVTNIAPTPYSQITFRGLNNSVKDF